jgi:gluconate 2-dehydrogenase gamma chain
MSHSEDNTLSRRALLRGASLCSGGLIIGLSLHKPLALAAMADPGAAVLNPAQWKTVEAITGRIIPTDHQPGAIEANCVNFIDKALANEDAALVPDFIVGLSLLDRLCEARSGASFVELEPEQQDQVLKAMQSGTARPWATTEPTAGDFFEVMRTLTIMGFMADPSYGGNADMAGWRVARYPGPRHHKGGYTPAQMVGEEPIVTLWGDKM